MATPSLARKRVIKVFSLNWNFLFASLITKGSGIRGRLEGNLRVFFFSLKVNLQNTSLFPSWLLGCVVFCTVALVSD